MHILMYIYLLLECIVGDPLLALLEQSNVRIQLLMTAQIPAFLILKYVALEDMFAGVTRLERMQLLLLARFHMLAAAMLSLVVAVTPTHTSINNRANKRF